MKKFLIVLSIVLLLIISCDSNLDESINKGKLSSTTVTITLQNTEDDRTVMPDHLEAADSYEATLTSTDNRETRSYKSSVNSGETTISFDEVEIGSYKIDVVGTLNGQTVSRGSSTIIVSATTTNKATVQLESVVDEGTGSVSILIDWSEAAAIDGYFKDMYDYGPFTFEFYKREELSDGTTQDTLLADPQTAEKGVKSYTFNADNVPVSKGFIGFFKIKSENALVMELGFASFQIYAGQTSTPDENDKDLFKITQSNAPTYPNGVSVSAAYGANDPETEITLTFVVRGSSGNDLYSSIAVALYETKTGNAVASATIPVEVKDGEKTLDYTFTGLTSGVSYTAKVVGTTLRGKETEMSSATASTKVLVTGLTVSGTLPKDALTYDEKIALSAAITPSNATIGDVTWSVSDKSVLSLTQINNNALIYGKKPGKATISVQTKDALRDGSYAYTELGEVSVILSTPTPTVTTDITSETKQSYITVMWDSINYADNYEVWRSVNGGDATKVDTVVTTAYDDYDLVAGCSYAYSVKAKSSQYDGTDFTPDSALSELSEAYTPIKPDITLVQPTLENFVLQIYEGEDIVPGEITVTPEKKHTISIPKKVEGTTSTEWYVNGKFVKSGLSVELSSSMSQVQGMDADANTLTLVVTTEDGLKYSKSIYFRVVAVLDEGVADLKLLNKETSSNFSSYQTNCYYIPTTASLSIKTEVLPVDATIKTLSYESSDTAVAEIDTNGSVTIKKNGTVTFTVTSTSGHTKTATVTFFTEITQERILHYVTNYLKTPIENADKKFGYDWWYLTEKSYSENGVNCKRNSTASIYTQESNGYIRINSGTTVNAGDYGTFTMNTTQDIKVWAKDCGTKGYHDADNLQYVGYNKEGCIHVDLPYGQGSATITFDAQLDYLDSNSGTYRVKMTNKNDQTFAYSSYKLK